MRNSRQRKIIETVLKELPEHVTAIEVHRNARVFDETISLATVYRNLRLMVEWGNFKKVLLPNGNFCYDPIIENHSHFYCEKCKRLSNIKLRKSKLNLMRLKATNNIEINDIQITVTGSCGKCLNNIEKTK